MPRPDYSKMQGVTTTSSLGSSTDSEEKTDTETEDEDAEQIEE